VSRVAGHLLEVQGLAVEFHTAGGAVHAVRGVDWHVDGGEVLAILGESGSGKSVSAAAVMNLIDSPPGYVTAGRILYRGQDLLTMPAEARRGINGRKIAMIFQDPLAHLNPVYSVGWQIAETMTAHGAASGAQARARAIELLRRVGIPEPERRVADYPHQFSGGQRQRVMIAIALALRPELLIADEPTTALDVTVQAQILALLQELQAETGMGLILITHDLGVVAELADRVAVMHDGRIVETGPVRRVYRTPEHPYTRRLMAAIPGRTGRAGASGSAAAAEPPLLCVGGLAKHYEVTTGLLRRRTGTTVRAVDSVSFDLHAGETLGLVGESGSGKSTLVRALLRLEEPTAGSAHYRGRDVFALPPRQLLQLRRRIQVVFQDPYASLNPRMTVAGIIAEPWSIHRDVLPKRQWPGRVCELLEQVGLAPEHARRYPHQFSGGQRQRIAIARALALQPEVIICDEAVSALDVSIQAQVIALLAELRRTFGLAYIFIAHDLPVVRHFADRVMVMHRGRIVEQGPTEEIFERPQHPYTRALLAASPLPDPDVRRRRDSRRPPLSPDGVAMRAAEEPFA
jgi:peptide/nickel transport system ATP-binding protein